MTRAYRSPSSDNREVLIGAQTSCGAEVLRGAGALAREHSGKRTTSVLEPALSEAEGAEQLPFLIVIPSGFSREQSAVDNPVRTCGADPSCPRDSVPDNVRRERPRSCWHRLREDSLVPLDKSEGVVKTEISWAVREHRFFAREG